LALLKPGLSKYLFSYHHIKKNHVVKDHFMVLEVEGEVVGVEK